MWNIKERFGATTTDKFATILKDLQKDWKKWKSTKKSEPSRRPHYQIWIAHYGNYSSMAEKCFLKENLRVSTGKKK